MPQITMYAHPNEVHGMTQLADGRWCLWAEGNSTIQILTPDDPNGRRIESVEPWSDKYAEVSRELANPPPDDQMAMMNDAMAQLFLLVRSKL